VERTPTKTQGKGQIGKRKEQKKTKRAEKAKYTRPGVTRVSLRPEEAVLGHCKVTGAAGPSSGTAACSKMGLRCSSQGS
jgi:hypothetical protein